MICELIVIGCLLLHGDIPTTRTKRFLKAYSADWIINGLTELHEHFYPIPGDQVLDDLGNVIEMRTIKKPYMTKEKLLKLYAYCGNILHRGTLRSVLASDQKPMDLIKVVRSLAEISLLLNAHQMPLIGLDREIWVVMKSTEDGNVHCFVMHRDS